jgi:hypothetical protein
MNARPLLTTVLGGAGALLLLGGCGFGAAQQHPPTITVQDRLHTAAQCMRDHGYPDFPDPTLDANGKPQLPPGTNVPDTIPAPCQALIDQAQQAAADAAGGSHQPTHDVAKLRQFAQCMRDNGLEDWPDPDAQGRFHLPTDLQGKGGPRWPAIQAAWSGPCAQYNPGSIDVAP